MAERLKNQARVYLRRSTGKQESGVYSQLEWAIHEAQKYGVTLDASRQDLDHMLAHGLIHHKHIYLDDGVTGADLTRAGFTAFRHETMNNRSISHLFIHMSDRFSRAELTSQAMQLEQELIYAGVTVVFSNRISKPRRKGETYGAEDMAMLYAYMESGEYLNKLAVRVIQTQMSLAKKGHWTGGQPPYGFVRVRVMADGTEQEMKRGTSIKQPGSHTEIRPKDENKIRVWIMALEWCHKHGWGPKRIARELNDLGIASPDAGRSRTERGRKHRVSGTWTPSTVRALLRNTAIMGMLRYGVQSEGHHRRLGENGPRLLEDHDQQDDKPKVICNPEDLIIRSALPGFAPPVHADNFAAAQAVLDERGKHQRGISKTKDPARYPLSTRVYDMNCGYPMYAKTSGDRRLYTCGRYINTDGRKCDHNQVDAEATLEFVLGVLRQRVLQCGGREALRKKLIGIAAAAADNRPKVVQHELQILQDRLHSLEQEVELLGTNLGRAQDNDEYKIISRQFREKRDEAASVRGKIGQIQPTNRAQDFNPADEAEKALQLFDQIELIAKHPESRAALRPLLKKLNLNLWLSFIEGTKGSRAVRRLAGGLITVGDGELPVRPYGGDDDDDDGDRPILVGATAGTLPTVSGENDTPFASVSEREDVSLSKVHRGDRIRTCGLLVPNQTLYQAELRPVALKSIPAAPPTANDRPRRRSRQGKARIRAVPVPSAERS